MSGLLRKVHPPQEVLEVGVEVESVHSSPDIRTGPNFRGQVTTSFRQPCFLPSANRILDQVRHTCVDFPEVLFRLRLVKITWVAFACLVQPNSGGMGKGKPTAWSGIWCRQRLGVEFLVHQRRIDGLDVGSFVNPCMSAFYPKHFLCDFRASCPPIGHQDVNAPSQAHLLGQ